MLAVLGTARPTSATTDELFIVVPASDTTYGKLRDLASAGLLEPPDAQGPLTRFEVARRILKAEDHYKRLVVALASVDIPPPPEDSATPLKANPGDSLGPGTAATDEGAEPDEIPEVPLEQAAAELHSLRETYQFELDLVQKRLKALQDRMDEIESRQFEFRKKQKSLENAPSVTIHGLGRAMGIAQHLFGDFGAPQNHRSLLSNPGYLDLAPEGIVSKEVRWKSIFRIGTTFQPNETVVFVPRWIEMDLTPPWFSATFGDFKESYSPLVLWNRNALDLRYAPDAWTLRDQRIKYESFLDGEPSLPFRGLRLGTALMWPQSKWFESFKASGFVHMVKNGFDDDITGSGWFFGPNKYTDMVYAGRLALRSPKWRLGNRSLQAGLETQGVLMDEPLGTDTPGAVYNPMDTTTWAHQYRIGSLKPDLALGVGSDSYLGAAVEYGFSNYIDDKHDGSKSLSDYALLGGPYFHSGDSKVQLNVVDVGPYYYSPLAQTRQDAVTNLSNVASQSSPDLFQPAWRSRYFITGIGRPNQIYSFYDRTQDNVMPYGLATPNRKGAGLELDLKFLKARSLRILGSAYSLQQLTSDLAFNSTQTGFVPVDDPAGAVAAPVRKYTYVNLGPSYDLGPTLGIHRILEIGTNLRMERTESSLGTLKSAWALGGLKVGILPSWDVSFAFSRRQANGKESGYNGTLWARDPYLFDGSDVGAYSTVSVDGFERSLRFQSVLRAGRNSTFILDMDRTTGNLVPANMSAGMMTNQYVELTYEVLF